MSEMLKSYTADELKTILENHKHWWDEDCEGWEKMRADLRRADLSGADLSGAYLGGADLSGADLRRADLRRADLSGADLSGADLSGADLRRASGITMACPSDGAFIGWKKARTDSGLAIVKLEILEDAKRSSSTGRKCRCDKAKVLAVYSMDGKEIDQARSNYMRDFLYCPGEIIVPDSFDDNRWNECSNGIHFFITRQEAEDYDL